MATLILGAIGAGIGSVIPGVGPTLGFSIGATLSGALFPPRSGSQGAGALDDVRISGSGYGVAIPQVYGRARVGGIVIWGTDKVTHSKKRGPSTGPKTTTKTYTCTFAVAICAGPIASIKRIYAGDLFIYDDNIDLSDKYDIVPYLGTEAQGIDPTLAAKLGADATAFRGMAYCVFNDLDLTPWNGQLPPLEFVVDSGHTQVSEILEGIAAQVGIDPAEYDFSDAADTIRGFVISSRTSAKDAIDPVMRAYATDLIETDEKIIAVKRGGAVGITVNNDHLGAAIYNGGDSPKVKIETRRLTEIELPSRVDLSYFSDNGTYRQSTQGAVRYAKPDNYDAVTVATPLILTDTEARQVAETLLYTQWLERTTYTFSLPPRYLRTVPGDVLLLPVNGTTTRVRIVGRDVGLFGEIRFTAVPDLSDLTQSVVGEEGEITEVSNGGIVTTAFTLWAIPVVRDEDESEPGFYVAATGAEGWTGCAVYYSPDGGTSWVPCGTILERATFGVATTALADSTAVGADNTHSVTVELETTGILEGSSAVNVENGENASVLGEEILGFATADLTAAMTYDLSDFYRGFRASEMTDHTNTDRFVLLGNEILRVNVPVSLMGTTVKVKCVAAGEVLGDVASQDVYIPNPASLTAGVHQNTVISVADPRLSNSNRTLTWDLSNELDSETVHAAVRGYNIPPSQVTLTNDDDLRHRRLVITLAVGDAFFSTDEVSVWGVPLGAVRYGAIPVFYTAVGAGAQTIPIGFTPKGGSVRVWTRGYWLKSSAWSVAGTDLSIPSEPIAIGDQIVIFAIPSDSPVAIPFKKEFSIPSDGYTDYLIPFEPMTIDGARAYEVEIRGYTYTNPSLVASGDGSMTTVRIPAGEAFTGDPLVVRGYHS